VVSTFKNACKQEVISPTTELLDGLDEALRVAAVVCIRTTGRLGSYWRPALSRIPRVARVVHVSQREPDGQKAATAAPPACSGFLQRDRVIVAQDRMSVEVLNALVVKADDDGMRGWREGG